MRKGCKNPPDLRLEERYQICHDQYLVPFCKILEEHLKELFKSQKRIDRISARAKSPKSFLNKANKSVGEKLKYSDPIRQIQDQIGARIVVFYTSDVEIIDRTIRSYFTLQENSNRVPESQWAFGYFGQHYIARIPSDLRVLEPVADMPRYFELQVKTLFQHAWSEASHDLAYKPGARKLIEEEERKLAFASAQSWGADQLFAELFTRLHGSSRKARDDV